MKLKPFNRPQGHICQFSTGLCGGTTAGTGKLDDNGYWEFPCRECATLMALATGELRIVHKQRKRKLRKRGTRVWWSDVANSYVWEPSRV